MSTTSPLPHTNESSAPERCQLVRTLLKGLEALALLIYIPIGVLSLIASSASPYYEQTATCRGFFGVGLLVYAASFFGKSGAGLLTSLLLLFALFPVACVGGYPLLLIPLAGLTLYACGRRQAFLLPVALLLFICGCVAAVHANMVFTTDSGSSLFGADMVAMMSFATSEAALRCYCIFSRKSYFYADAFRPRSAVQDAPRNGLRKLPAILLGIVVLGSGFFVAADRCLGYSKSARDKETLLRFFELDGAGVSDASWVVINDVTGQDDGFREIPTQDASYHVEGAFRVATDFLPTEGTPRAAEAFMKCKGKRVDDWLQNDDFQARIIKRKNLRAEILFSPSTGWVVFKITPEGE